MKPFTRTETILFDSTNACFSLSVQATFVRKNQNTGNLDPTVFTNDYGTSRMNPSIYLVLSYKAPDRRPDNNDHLYTSYPQLFALRGALEELKERLLNPASFVDTPTGLDLTPLAKEAIVLANIGARDKAITFQPQIIQVSDVERAPGISIQISSAEAASVLTLEEFLTIYTIVKDVDLTSIQINLSGWFLYASGLNQPQAPAYNYQPQQRYQQQPRQQWTQPSQQTGGYQQQPQRTAATGSNYQQRTVAPQSQTKSYEERPAASGSSAPMSARTTQKSLSATNIANAIENTKVEPLNYDVDSQDDIDALFASDDE